MNNTSPNAAEWFEIPTADISKSVPFYNQGLGLQLESVAWGPGQIAMVPSGAGSVVYLPTNDMDAAVSNVSTGGGSVVIPKKPIGPGMGFFARFQDPEGNLVGLCSRA